MSEKPFILELTIMPSTITEEKCTSQKSSTTFLKQTDLQMSLTKWQAQTSHKVTLITPFQTTGSQEQCVWQIKEHEYYYSTGIIPCHQWLCVRTFHFKVQIHLQVLKRCFASPGFVQRDLFTPSLGVNNPSDNYMTLMVSLIAPLHLLLQDDQNEMQHDFQSFDTVGTSVVGLFPFIQKSISCTGSTGLKTLTLWMLIGITIYLILQL